LRLQVAKVLRLWPLDKQSHCNVCSICGRSNRSPLKRKSHVSATNRLQSWSRASVSSPWQRLVKRRREHNDADLIVTFFENPTALHRANSMVMRSNSAMLATSAPCVAWCAHHLQFSHKGVQKTSRNGLKIGRRSGFRTPDSDRENIKIGPPAIRRPAGASIEAFPTGIQPRSGPQARFPARKHYCVV
jgi:hypothetical protein